MNDTRKHELQSRIEELEASLTELKGQFIQEAKKEQHAEIDNLEVYLEAVDKKYENLRDFWPIVVSELQGIFSNLSSDKKEKSE